MFSPHNPNQPNYSNQVFHPNQPFRPNLQTGQVVPVQTERIPFPKNPKFHQKFDSAKVSIEDYLQCLSRWKVSNNISDTQAISTGLENFTDIGLANNIDGNLTGFEKANFDAFVSTLTLAFILSSTMTSV